MTIFGAGAACRQRVSEKPDECLPQQKISRLEQPYGTLSAKDSLLGFSLHLADDV